MHLPGAKSPSFFHYSNLPFLQPNPTLVIGPIKTDLRLFAPLCAKVFSHALPSANSTIQQFNNLTPLTILMYPHPYHKSPTQSGRNVGKVARLPQDLRDLVNTMLRDGATYDA